MALVLLVTLLLAFASPSKVECFNPPPSFLPPVRPPVPVLRRRDHRDSCLLRSTPFDLDLYSDPDNKDGRPAVDVDAPTPDAPPLAAPSSTRLIIGLTKHSHDAALCAADASTGRVLFALAKERLTRKKHDGGNSAALVEACLDTLDLGVENIDRVVLNNHHHRILPLEADAGRVAWEEGLGINGGDEDGHADEYNLLAGVADKVEMSHHLAHAYSAVAQCPFATGMAVVMDGMGETYRTMQLGMEDDSYMSELTLCDAATQLVPPDIEERAGRSHFDWREAESVYTFAKADGELRLTPVFKRFTEECTPPARYNHGFADMDSLGALYSRASSHIFGDWNACGKVMGLAPWQDHVWDNANAKDGASPQPHQVKASTIKTPIFEGSLYDQREDKSFRINRSSMTGLPFVARMDSDLFDDKGNMVREKRYDFDDNDYIPPKPDDDEDGTEEKPPSKQLPTRVALDAIGLASRVQGDLETTALDLVRHFKNATGASHLCLAGGVALNSVLNGRMSRELGFERMFVPPYPGDDGIAVGCCAFGLFGMTRGCGAAADAKEEATTAVAAPPLWNEPLSPYLGPLPTDDEMREAIAAAAPWLEVETIWDEGQRDDLVVAEITDGGIVAIYNGRSEVGPRALGHRSILADPRKKGLVRFINEFVKKRESFRPFAPSCLAEEAGEWFELGDGDNLSPSPYMSITAPVKESKRDLIPAVTHVDGSSRLQTVTPDTDPGYHRLISAFYRATGVPMVLNTSFNTLPGEPIVESPRDAVRSFLASMGAIEMLVMGEYVIKRKAINVRTLLGEKERNGAMLPPSLPKRAGAVTFKTTFSAGNIGDERGVSDSVTHVQMRARPIHNDQDGGWFTLLDDLEGQLLGICDGTVGVNEILTHFAAIDEKENLKKVTENDQVILQNIIHRLIRLCEHTLISW